MQLFAVIAGRLKSNRGGALKVLIAIIVTAVIAGGLAFGLAAMRGLGTMGQELAAPVRIEPAAKGELVEFVTAPGKVEPKTKVAISARVAARIVALPCEEGEEVTKGGGGPNGAVPATLLVKLDSKDLEAALRSSQARRNAQAASIEVENARIAGQKSDLKAMNAELRLKELELKRNRELLASRDVSQSIVDEMLSAFDAMVARIESTGHAIDSAEKNLVVLQHNLEAAEAEIARAEDNLAYTTIVSPIDGVVTRLDSEVGELAIVGTTNTPGTTIMEVADLSRMVLKAEVDEADVGGIREGQKAKVRVQAYPDRVFDGTVTQIALTATQEPGQAQTKYFEVEVLLDTGGERIYSGLSADVDIEVQEHKGVLKVPSQAVLGRTIDDLPPEIQKHELVDRGKSITAVVYLAQDGKAVVTPVKIGASDGAYTVIEAGLNEGDPVIVGPFKVLEGLRHAQTIVDETEVTDEQRKAYYDRTTTPVQWNR